MFFVKRLAKVTFNVFCGNPKSIFTYSHIAKHFSSYKLYLSFVVNQTRTYGRFATANIHNFALSVAKLIYTLTNWCFLGLGFSKRMPITKRHYTASIGKQDCLVNQNRR